MIRTIIILICLILAEFVTAGFLRTTDNTTFYDVNNTTSPYKTSSLIGGARIIGGISVLNENGYPYYGYPANDKTVCGATLIWNDLLITAAHCDYKIYWSKGIRIGGNRADGSSQKTKEYKVIKATKHPKYNSKTHENDIMILRIAGNSTGPFVQLNYNPSLPNAGTKLSAIGYGKTSNRDGSYPNVLKTANFTSVSFQRCSAYYKNRINDRLMICNGFKGKKNKADTCSGDSGGPILLAGTNKQVGIVSWGYKCAKKGVPGVNTRVSPYKTWIQNAICHLSKYPPSKC